MWTGWVVVQGVSVYGMGQGPASRAIINPAGRAHISVKLGFDGGVSEFGQTRQDVLEGISEHVSHFEGQSPAGIDGSIGHEGHGFVSEVAKGPLQPKDFTPFHDDPKGPIGQEVFEVRFYVRGAEYREHGLPPLGGGEKGIGHFFAATDGYKTFEDDAIEPCFRCEFHCLFYEVNVVTRQGCHEHYGFFGVVEKVRHVFENRIKVPLATDAVIDPWQRRLQGYFDLTYLWIGVDLLYDFFVDESAICDDAHLL